MSTSYMAPAAKQHQRGLTLVELMIAVAINLVVVLVAAYLYLQGRSTQQSMEERAALFENGQLALELLGKEIGNAGYYPAQMQEPDVKINTNLGRYVNPSPAVAAFQAGVFGCNSGRFESGGCVAADHKNFEGDGLVLNYFTEDALTAVAGARADCLGAKVDNDPLNDAIRAGAGHGSPNRTPEHPLFVSNRYTLTYMKYRVNGTDIPTFGLACQGNGKKGSLSYQPLVPGIEQFRVRYGLRDASGARATQYLPAGEVGTAAAIIVNDETMQGWERVVSVQVCVVARSLSKTRFTGAGKETRLDCDGNTLSSSDGVQRRRFMQVFAVKNRLS